jgi:hypothetical protein
MRYFSKDILECPYCREAVIARGNPNISLIMYRSKHICDSCGREVIRSIGAAIITYVIIPSFVGLPLIFAVSSIFDKSSNMYQALEIILIFISFTAVWGASITLLGKLFGLRFFLKKEWY